MNMKRCHRCEKEKLIKEFGKDRSRKDGYLLYCKSCMRKQRKKYYASDKGKLCIRETNLKKVYGITLEQYDKMFDNQNGICAICGQPETVKLRNIVKRLSVDHDHKTGKIRALLCNNCNLGLRAIESKGFIKKAKQYLKGHSN